MNDAIPSAAEIAAEIMRRLPRVSQDDALWDSAAVADYLGISVRTVEDVRYREGFPAPRWPVDSPRWIASEVIEWAKLQKAKVPKARKRKAA